MKKNTGSNNNGGKVNKTVTKNKNNRAAVAAANGKTLGRSKGAVSCISVSAADLAKLVNAMPNLMIPVHRKTAGIFGLTGVPFNATIANINQISKTYKSATNLVVQDLNAEPVSETTETVEA